MWVFSILLIIRYVNYFIIVLIIFSIFLFIYLIKIDGETEINLQFIKF